MAQKDKYSNEEWQLIIDGPEYVLAALAAADGKISIPEKMKEAAVFMKTVENYKAKSGLVKEVIADDSKPAKIVSGADLNLCIKQLGRINDLLVEKELTKVADTYRDFLLATGQDVAEAVSEKLFGMSVTISPKEAEALKKIKTALESRPSKVDPKPKPVKKTPTQRTRKASEGVVPRRSKTPKPAAPKKEYIAEHTVEAGETLSHISLKYYNSAVKAKYMLIYEENKEVIGDNPNLIRVGQVFKIPKLD